MFKHSWKNPSRKNLRFWDIFNLTHHPIENSDHILTVCFEVEQKKMMRIIQLAEIEARENTLNLEIGPKLFHLIT